MSGRPTFARGLLARLRRSRAGSVAIEFALLGPMMIAMLLGVLQIGIAMQAYNALRSVAADVGRRVAVEYQNNNHLTNSQIQQLGTATAVAAPYILDSANVNVSVVDAATQRVTGAREMTFTITYTVPSVLTVLDLPAFLISFQRPIFVAA